MEGKKIVQPKLVKEEQDLFNSLFSVESNKNMEDKKIVQPKLVKQEEDYESRLQATAEKLRAGYKRIEDAKKQRCIKVIKVNKCKSDSKTGFRYYFFKDDDEKSCQERIEWKLRQLKNNRRPKINRDFY